MRIGVECKGNPAAGGSGLVKVELSRVGMDALSDERPTLIVEEPPPTAGKARMSVPDFDCRPVEGPDDDLWSTLDWPEDVATVASCVEKDGSQIVIYYSRAFPDYRKAFDDYEKKDVALAQSFDTHYQTWVTVHALLHYQDVEAGTATEDDEAEKFAREEFVRVAKVAALMARREVAMAATAVGSGES
jgi:hypothetical protein